uniref:hypothetical protein n=1 Tax=Salmonella sp. SAL04281 TaxID=3159859 RepID=UPI00397A4745
LSSGLQFISNDLPHHCWINAGLTPAALYNSQAAARFSHGSSIDLPDDTARLEACCRSDRCLSASQRHRYRTFSAREGVKWLRSRGVVGYVES